MDIKVLGILSVEEGGIPITPMEAQVRQVLALLAAQVDHTVPTVVLVEELWPVDPPQHATDIVERHIRRLRDLISAALSRAALEAPHGSAHREPRSADTVLASRSGGYRLDSGGGTSDAWTFARAAGAGYRAMETEDFETAAGRLRDALGLWTAEPYAGVLHGPHLRAHAEQLEQSWQRALDQWIATEMQLGRHLTLHADLSLLLSRFRARQPLYEGLMTELRRTGDPFRVLQAYKRLRRGTPQPRVPRPAAAPVRMERSFGLSASPV